MKRFKKYIAEPTRRTPGILLEPGRISIMGRSISENPGELYRPAYEWIREYIRNNHTETTVEFGFEYINTSSTKWIYNIIREIAGVEDFTGKAKLIWYYEKGDDDMCELGLILRSLVDCPFSVVELVDMKRTPGDPIPGGDI